MTPKFEKYYMVIEEFKVYIVIFGLTAIFIATTFYSLHQIKHEFNEVAKNYRKSITNELGNYVNEWMRSRVDTVKSQAKLLPKNHELDEISRYLKDIQSAIPLFDTFQLFIDQDKFIVPSENILVTGAKELEEISLNKWYQDTKNSDKTTITIIQTHKALHEKTINICSPVYNEKKSFVGVFCGIIKANEILSRIKNIDESVIDYLFLLDKNGQIITSYRQNCPINSFLKDENLQFLTKEFIYNNIIITISKITGNDWMVGIGINDSKLVQKSINLVAKTITQILLFFMILAFVVNYLQNQLYQKIKRRKQEFEAILTHQLKLIESGELIGVIAHQIKQPLNSTTLMLSSILQLKKSGNLSQEDEISSLKLSLKSLNHLNKTVENFRNFYKFDEKESTFKLSKSVESLMEILHVEFAQKNISIIKEFNEDFEIKNRQNLLNQVLLVLLQNSKDALVACYVNDFKKRMIKINSKFDDKFAYIEVIDCAFGVDEKIVCSLFSNLKKSDKIGGSGIGLYLAKKIALEKLGGDLRLKSKINPTIFELKIKR